MFIWLTLFLIVVIVALILVGQQIEPNRC